MSSTATIPLDLDGYTDLPPGRIANVVTYLEMRSPDAGARAPLPPGFSVERIEQPQLDAYRALYSRIGRDWLWFSRMVMADDTLAALLADPSTEIYFLLRGEEPVGLCEIHRGADEAEIAMFGVVPEVTGTGAARGLMSASLDAAWQGSVGRVWLHTCTFDHPAAIPFYRKMGFVPFKFAIEVSRDPRLTGHLPESAGPHVALLK